MPWLGNHDTHHAFAGTTKDERSYWLIVVSELELPLHHQ
jgi:hypothetical protein